MGPSPTYHPPEGEECKTLVEHGLPLWAEPAVGYCSRRPRPSPMWGSRFVGARAVGPWVGEQKLLGKTAWRGNPSPESINLPTLPSSYPNTFTPWFVKCGTWDLFGGVLCMLCLLRFLLDHLIFFIAVTLVPLFVGLAIGGVLRLSGLGHDGLWLLGLDGLGIDGEWLDITQGPPPSTLRKGSLVAFFPLAHSHFPVFDVFRQCRKNA